MSCSEQVPIENRNGFIFLQLQVHVNKFYLSREKLEINLESFHLQTSYLFPMKFPWKKSIKLCKYLLVAFVDH